MIEQLPRNMFVGWIWEEQVMFRMLASWIRNFGADKALTRSQLFVKCASYQSEIFEAMLEDGLVEKKWDKDRSYTKEDERDELSRHSEYQLTYKAKQWIIDCVLQYEHKQQHMKCVPVRRKTNKGVVYKLYDHCMEFYKEYRTYQEALKKYNYLFNARDVAPKY